MHDRDAAFDKAIREAPILADALLQLLCPESAQREVDSAETESIPATFGGFNRRSPHTRLHTPC